jgi:hypothetical protein
MCPITIPMRKYNTAMDVAAAKQVFNSGVPLYVMPLDATQYKLDEIKRQLLFTESTNLTDDLSLLYLHGPKGSVSRHRLVRQCCRGLCDQSRSMPHFTHEDRGRR